MSNKSHKNSALEGVLKGNYKPPRKHQHSFYISDEVYETFMAKCEKLDVPGSRVVEALLKDFIERDGKG